MITILRRFPLACVCVLGWSQAHANVCVRYVGNTATNSQCTDNSVQSAINNSNCAQNEIVLTSTAPYPYYTEEKLTISNPSLTIEGSSNPCGGVAGTNSNGTPATGPLITISGSGQTTNSVITISGNSNVTLKNLEITLGKQGGLLSKGGGITFNGFGSLTLEAATITNNQASLGGGIYMSPPAGSSATLTLQSNVFIQHNTAAFYGGGIYFDGSGSLTLSDTEVNENTATLDSGGGIYMDAENGANATLTLGFGSNIELNSAATDGGGIFIRGNTHLIAVSDFSQAYENNAGGHGGGIALVGPARADIGSGGYPNQTSFIFANSAAYGGGIAALANTGTGDAIVQLFTANPNFPITLHGNIATAKGGAIYLQSGGNNFKIPSAQLCAMNFRIDDNRAPEGAAIYVDGITGSGIEFGAQAALSRSANEYGYCAPQMLADFGAVDCAAGVLCNELSGNIAEDANRNPTSGSIIYVGYQGIFYGEHISMRSNQSGYAIHDVNSGGNGYAALLGSLIADNQFTQQLFLGESGSLAVDSDTLADDTIGSDYVIEVYGGTHLDLRNTIIHEGNKFTLYQPGSLVNNPNLNVRNNLSNDTTTLPLGNNASGDPLFVDQNNGNFHLLAYTQNGHVTISPAIDHTPEEDGTSDDSVDLDGNPFCLTLPIDAGKQPCDVGAYEAQPIYDRIFADAFGDRTSLVY